MQKVCRVRLDDAIAPAMTAGHRSRHATISSVPKISSSDRPVRLGPWTVLLVSAAECFRHTGCLSDVGKEAVTNCAGYIQYLLSHEKPLVGLYAPDWQCHRTAHQLTLELGLTQFHEWIEHATATRRAYLRRMHDPRYDHRRRLLEVLQDFNPSRPLVLVVDDTCGTLLLRAVGFPAEAYPALRADRAYPLVITNLGSFLRSPLVSNWRRRAPELYRPHYPDDVL